MRFEHSDDFYPPGLIVPVHVSRFRDSPAKEARAQIDTGADMSVVPDVLKQELGLVPRGRVRVQGAFDRVATLVPVYWIHVIVTGCCRFEVEVVSGPDSCFLLGRDVLNQIVLHADGRAHFFELTESSVEEDNR